MQNSNNVTVRSQRLHLHAENREVDVLTAAVRCADLLKRYGDVVAVDGLSFEVRRGECFGLLGPNGAGKTTTIEILEGLLAPDAGEVEVLGLRWQGDERELRQRLGVQLQETQLTDKLTVEETLRLFRSFYDRGRTIDELLGLVELESKRCELGGEALGRSEAALVDGVRARRRSGFVVPRRANDGARSAIAPAAVGRAAAIPRRRRHRPVDDALHGRGRECSAIAWRSSITGKIIALDTPKAHRDRARCAESRRPPGHARGRVHVADGTASA